MHPEQLADLASSHRVERERAAAAAARRGTAGSRRLTTRARALRARHAAGWTLVELGLRLAVPRDDGADALTSR
ncbi:MAG TPA: hypothetical protein VMU75_08680 [Acidimicrobiales bacterium]|nr:hypothetical protein [Acidimicrobiales bacterium]